MYVCVYIYIYCTLSHILRYLPFSLEIMCYLCAPQRKPLHSSCHNTFSDSFELCFQTLPTRPPTVLSARPATNSSPHLKPAIPPSRVATSTKPTLPPIGEGQ